MKSRALICLILAAALALSALPAALGEEKVDNMLRVQLTRLQLTDRLEISADGAYSVNDTYFQRGSRLVASAQEGHVLLYYEGMCMDCGTQLTLTRHASDDSQENGLRFNGAFYLHPGSLLLTNRNGQLDAVLLIDVEDYLWGVVPYEMSESYPMAALRAQAIAARTYALRKKTMHQPDWDLVDNTNDQAYYGIQAEYVNARRAVEDTAGICAFARDGSLAMCYYSASNGGQTELASHVWGLEDPDYLPQQPDPYDLENSAATVRRFTVPKDFAACPQALRDALTEAAGPAFADAEFLTIQALRLEAPKFPGSLIMTQAVFTLSCLDPAQEEEEEIYLDPDAPAESDTWREVYTEVTLPVFPTLASICNLSINGGSGNEIVTVLDETVSFVLESRRFGHGVGMSQRGAQRMAEKGFDYREILAFYYPGTSLDPYPYPREVTPVPGISAAFLTTPGPAASPTPRPTLVPIDQSRQEGDVILTVDQIAPGSYLNLRFAPSTASMVVRQLSYGQKLILTEEVNEYWYRVKADGIEGYVMREFVSREE